MFHSIPEALNDLKTGKVIIVCDDESRENEGDFVALADHVTPDIINFMVTHGKGLLCAPLSSALAKKLELSPMVQNNTDSHETAFTVSLDHHSATTGISAYERAKTLKALVHPSSAPDDFSRPGHIFPLVAKEGGVLERPGHTEAAIELAKLAGASPVGVICEILNSDGSMARRAELLDLAHTFNLKIITIKALMDYIKATGSLVKREVQVQLPTDYGPFTMIAYSNTLDDKEHLAMIKGHLTADAIPLVRLHSECLTGDVFGSARCDCGPQLHLALKHIAAEGQGVLLYLRQEGRGIGLTNKLRAYALQEQGLDTVEANVQLGFAPDLRDYSVAIHMLRDLGIRQCRLLTNNPEKVTALTQADISVVERIAIEVPKSEENTSYLQTKAEKMGHLLHL
ncbi:riboflavin biosynthesis protein RibBA [Pullulanibacillus camelliae]|uniref:Riboflavin biosynthesis protein RibBA n=1 Tax=Pullulanibacillus camelliae TaxID=1707096 RepID=A0A8J3DTE6_9BACL|nr:bifunctional 3,4-dihydroxy-2-butanone-4-phosphate synthase/GTP cyclohydrolase II [Pullulanibacillus camelliae]GGE44100.1 riboflavin biosynthesis protein RibBA [Pullulanibacillus camelliae]